MTVFVVIIDTESGDHGQMVFKKEPSKKKLEEILAKEWECDFEAKTLHYSIYEEELK